MSRVLVTGGLGFVGSAISSQLLHRGHDVISLDNLSTSPNNQFEGLRNFALDYGDPSILSKLRDFEPFSIIHCANSAYVQESILNPIKYLRNNVYQAISMLSWVEKLQVEKLVFSSSCAVYGSPHESIPISESAPLCPISPYGTSKKMAEEIFQLASNHLGFKYVSLRYFNVSGSLPEYGIEENHRPETHVIPLMIESAKKSGRFTVFGHGLSTPDGSPVRDFIHIRDLADAHIKALEYLDKEQTVSSINLGSGVGTSLLDLRSSVEKLFGNFEIEQVESRKGDPAYLVADIRLARNELDWYPQFSNIETILSDIHRQKLTKSNVIGEPQK